MNSILTSVKKLLGIAEECTDFDADIIMYINMALFALVQMGMGPGEGYAISGKENEWTEFVADPVKVEAVKAYVAVKVRLLGFDPPQSSTTMEALKNTASEMEWRLNVEHDNTWDGQSSAMGGALDGNTREKGLVWAGNAGYLQRMRPTGNMRMPG